MINHDDPPICTGHGHAIFTWFKCLVHPPRSQGHQGRLQRQFLGLGGFHADGRGASCVACLFWTLRSSREKINSTHRNQKRTDPSTFWILHGVKMIIPIFIYGSFIMESATGLVPVDFPLNHLPPIHRGRCKALGPTRAWQKWRRACWASASHMATGRFSWKNQRKWWLNGVQ